MKWQSIYYVCILIVIGKHYVGFALAANRLFIVRGRWKSIPRVDRKCTLCNEIEDEYHVMLICPRYAVLGKKYNNKYHIVKPSMYKFVARLNVENIKEQERLAVFTKSVIKEHNKQFSYTCKPTFF